MTKKAKVVFMDRLTQMTNDMIAEKVDDWTVMHKLRSERITNEHWFWLGQVFGARARIMAKYFTPTEWEQFKSTLNGTTGSTTTDNRGQAN